MRNPKITITGIAVAVLAATGGIAFAATSGGSSSHRTAGASGPTIHTATATVQGQAETILVDGSGLPLYTYQPDTATKSKVTGGLAALWPPLVSGSPTATGTTGRLSTVTTQNGDQVEYNGHFLYTFVEDGPKQVTGQGVQNFFVATPDLADSAPPAPSTNYGY